MSNPEIQKNEEREPTPESKADKGTVLSLDRAKKALIHSDRLQEKLIFAIDKIKKHPQWQSKVVDGFWKKLDAKDRELLYKGGKPSIFNVLKESAFPVPIPNTKYKKFSLKFFGDTLAKSVRPMVHYDLLPPPEGVSKEEVAKDIVTDQKSLRRLLTAVQILVSVFAPEIAEEVGEAKAIANQMVDMKTDISTKQQERKAA